MRRRKVLVVDDDPLVRGLLRAVLVGSEYQLDEASDGFEALRIAQEKPPDVVVLDVMMPGVNGYDVCRAMRADPRLRSTRIVILTARDTPQDRVEAAEAGADEYLTKPFSPVRLIESITTVGNLAG